MVHCAACDLVTIARQCHVPGCITPVGENPVVKCSHCGDTRQYLESSCFLSPFRLASEGGLKRINSTVAIIAGMVAAVRLARVEPGEIQRQSPRVRSIISEGITIARMILENVK